MGSTKFGEFFDQLQTG